MKSVSWVVLIVVGAHLAVAAGGNQPDQTASATPAREILDQLPSPRGICAILGDTRAELAIAMAHASQWQVYVQAEGKARTQADNSLDSIISRISANVLW